MFKRYTIHLAASFALLSGILLTASGEGQLYSEKLSALFGKINRTPGARAVVDLSQLNSAGRDPLEYRESDWSEFVIDPSYVDMVAGREGLYSDGNIKIDTYGAVKFNFSYGDSFFTDDRYRQFDEDRPRSKVIGGGFFPEQLIQLHVEGGTGERIRVFIDHDSSREDNTYMMQYRAVSDREILREINAGQIDIKFSDSRYAVYDNTDAKGMGVDFTVKKDKLKVKAFGSIARGETAVEYFRGNTSSGSTRLAEYQYMRNTYYQLEPFIRYDNVSSAPAGGTAYSTVAMTSAPADPLNYTPYPVNISPEGFALYIDDRNQYNNNNAIQLSTDGGYYTRMVSGTDYSINYTTGVIRILRSMPDDSRILAVYSRIGGTLDPCAFVNADFAGRICVFIKYGTTINEDTDAKDQVHNATESDRNGDGRVNLDVYEIRSFYNIGIRQLVSGSVMLGFYEENSSMEEDEVAGLGRFRIDATEGTVGFYTREPFRPLLGSDRAARIYSEIRQQDLYVWSRYAIDASYRAEARSFQLEHGNIIENSLRVKINGGVLNTSRYRADYFTGMLTFVDPSNPLIGPDTLIEVKYEFLPYGGRSDNLIAGARADYQLGRDIRLGGSFLVSRSGERQTIPEIGTETDQTLLYEGDVSLNLPGGRIADFWNLITGSSINSAPFEFSAYGEYAGSYTDINTFGMALIDNMESSDETIIVSMSEKDWMLSSMPGSLGQADRGLLYYRFYRDPSSPETLRGESFTPYNIAYAVKPGPYNIATGHVRDSITEVESQRSLVMDYDFSSGTCVSIVTRKFSETPVDLTGMQYIEVWVRLEGTGSVDLYLDAGRVNEDSDGDGVLDKEDSNGNGYIDSDPGSGYSEDRGYSFDGNNPTVVGSGPGLNSSTKGDGVLNTEDLDSSGTLDTATSVAAISLGNVPAAAGVWQKIRVYVDYSSLPPDQVEALRSVTSLRLYARQNTGSTGRLFIDSLKLVTSRWKNPELDGMLIDDPGLLKVTLVSSINDTDYYDNSFMRLHPGLYESLYGGDRDDFDNTSESALQVDYNISTGSGVSITRTFSRAIDISNYSTLNLWINARTFPAGSEIGIIIGSSDYDYAEYRFVPLYSQLWEQKSLRLKGDSSGSIEKSSVNGSPDYKRIRYIKLAVYGTGTAGTLWLNEIYVTEPQAVKGSAQWYECMLKMTSPLARTSSGVPVLSDMLVRYTYKGHSSDFHSVNMTTKDISGDYHEVSTSAKVLPNWTADISYSRERTETDSLNTEVEEERRGFFGRDLISLNSVFRSTGGIVPDISFSYTANGTGNRRELAVTGNSYSEDKQSTVHTPVILYRQRFDSFLFGKLNADAGISMVFSESSVDRDSKVLPDSLLAGYVSLSDSEKKQKSVATVKLDYSNEYFFLRHSSEFISEEVVEAGGGDTFGHEGINGAFTGNFHLPFVSTRDMKFIERGRGASLVAGITWSDYFRPEYSVSMNYRENAFSDYTSPVADFTRSRNARSYMSSEIKIPVLLKKIPMFKNVRNLQFNYLRSIALDESHVPYEGEGHDSLSEEYGISRVLSGVGPDAFNLLASYPGCYFSGRGNAGRGRDFVYSSMNRGLADNGGETAEYNNALRLTDKFTALFSVGGDPVDFSLTASMSQICERKNISGIPGQVLTAGCGLSLEFNLMKIFDFWFFRENRDGLPYHASVMQTGVDLAMSDLVTFNIRETSASPFTGITFKMDRSSLAFRSQIDFRERRDHGFISTSLQPGERDYIYLQNIEGNNSFMEQETGIVFSMQYETSVQWIYDFFSKFYNLSGLPVFNLTYRLEIDRYDYVNSVSPEPYDLHYIESSLTLDLHRNIRGGLSARGALEKYRNRDTEAVTREVMSYEISGNISLVF